MSKFNMDKILIELKKVNNEAKVEILYSVKNVVVESLNNEKIVYEQKAKEIEKIIEEINNI